MYAETGLLYPYLQNFSQDIQQLEEYCRYQKTNASMSNTIPTSMISDYNIGGEGDLFKAPEPIIKEPVESSISMISFGDDSIQIEELLSEVFYGTKNDLMEKVNIQTPVSEILDIKIPVKNNDRINNEENKFLSDVSLLKSVSSGCLSSTEWIHGPQAGPSFLDCCEMDLRIVYGMRRAYSEGDMKTLDDRNINVVQSQIGQSLIIGGCSITEQRREQLSRYRNKKTKRNFRRKIKYACRKALADSQPRIRGRFAKTEESDASKRL